MDQATTNSYSGLDLGLGRVPGWSTSQPHTVGRARVLVCSGQEVRGIEQWRTAFSSVRKDRRYYEILEHAIQQFDYRYFVVQDPDGTVAAIQPFLLVDLDLLAGTSASVIALAARIRKWWPRFLLPRTLMVGCAAGEGVLDGDQRTQALVAHALGTQIAEHARALKAALIVLKEFPVRFREPLNTVLRSGFVRLPSLPMVRLDIRYRDFDDYMTRALSAATRKDLRRKFRAAAKRPALEMEVVADISSAIEEIYPLYLQVFNRSIYRFEKLTPEYFLSLGRSMSDKVRFFLWRREGRIVAFDFCMIQDDTIYDEYIGMDYSVALDLHLYFYMLRDVINWAIQRGCSWYVSSALNYEPKRRLRAKLEPLDLYVRHRSARVNAVLRRILPFVEPTRYHDELRKFPNYDDLWSRNAA